MHAKPPADLGSMSRATLLKAVSSRLHTEQVTFFRKPFTVPKAAASLPMAGLFSGRKQLLHRASTRDPGRWPGRQQEPGSFEEICWILLDKTGSLRAVKGTTAGQQGISGDLLDPHYTETSVLPSQSTDKNVLQPTRSFAGSLAGLRCVPCA